MALIVEDGTGLPNAESYCSVTYATAYHRARGVAESAWLNLDTPVREALLRKATDYMQARYGARWRGYPMVEAQSLSWPRGFVPSAEQALTSSSYYVADDSVPAIVANACAELALRANTVELMPDRLPTDRGNVIEETVGPITTRYAGGAIGSQPMTVFNQVDAMLAPFLLPGTSGAVRRLVRV